MCRPAVVVNLVDVDSLAREEEHGLHLAVGGREDERREPLLLPPPDRAQDAFLAPHTRVSTGPHPGETSEAADSL